MKKIGVLSKQFSCSELFRKPTSVFLIFLIVSSCLLAALITISPVTGAISFSSNIKVNDADYTGVKSSIDIAALDSGTILVVWQENRFADRDIFLSYSSNNGTTFSSDMIVNKNRTGNQVMPAIATGENDEVFVVWQDYRFGSKIQIAKSTDAGRTFDESIGVTNNTFGIESRSSVAVNDQTVAVAWQDGGSDSSIRIWDSNNGNLIKTLEGHTGAVRGIDFSPDGSKMISGGEDNLVKIWDTATWAFLTDVTTHDYSVTSVNWSHDGLQFATGSWDYTTKIWNSTNYALEKVLDQVDGQLTKNPVNDVEFSPDDSQIAVAYNGQDSSGPPDGTPDVYYNITVWNTTDWSNFTVNEVVGGGHAKSVNAVSFSPNGTLLASGAKDGRLKVWNSTTSALVETYPTAPMGLGSSFGEVNDIDWSPNGTYLAAGLRNGTIIIFNYSNPVEYYWLEGHNGRVNAVSWNAVMNEIASGASDPKAKVWNMTTKNERLNLPNHRNSVYSIAWSPDGGQIATGGGNSIEKWENEIQIYCSVSTDGGQTFGDSVVVSGTLEMFKHSPEIAIDQNDIISVVWYDERYGIADVYYANSTDYGASFNEEICVSAVPSLVANVPSLAVESDGTVHVVWQHQKNLDIAHPVLDIYYANSRDGFSRKIPVNHTDLPLRQQSPDVSVVPDGSQIYITWVDNRLGVYLVFLTNSSDGGMTFDNYSKVSDEDLSTKYTPTIATDKFGQSYLAWQDYRDVGVNIYFAGSVIIDTTPPFVINTIPINGSTNVSTFTTIQIEFSEPMNNLSVEDAFSLENGGTEINASDCEIEWNNYGNKVIFTPKSPLDPNTIYNGTVGNSSKDISGNEMLSNYTFSFTTSLNFNISLQQGWNLISLPLGQSDESIDQVLQSINGKWDCIQTYDPLDPSHWKTKATFKPEALNDLYSLDHTIAFWINITEPDVNLTVSGYIPTSTSIPLYAGWNLVGYPTQTEMKVSDALWGTGADRVEVFDPAEPYKIKNVEATYMMKPGEGYWVHVPVDTTWTIDW